MIFLFDLHCTQAYGETKFHGGGIYGRNLFIFFIQSIISGKNAEFSLKDIQVTKKRDICFDDELAGLIKSNSIPEIDVQNRKDVVAYIEKMQPDIFYSPLPESYTGLLTNEIKGSTKFLGTIHGLRDFEIHYTKNYVSYQKKAVSRIRQRAREIFRDHYIKNLKLYYKKLFSLMDGFLTVSEHSKHQILLYFPEIKPESIRVIFPIHFPEEINDIDNSVLDELEIEREKYFLMLNCNRPVKNVYFILEALDDFYRTEICEYKFVCIGFRDDQKKRIEKKYPRIYKQVVFVGYLESNKLANLYKNAYSLLFPSISEGFGYPSMEAMRYEIPVLASCLSAIPEVCSDAVLYFNPYDKAEMVNRILQLIYSKTLRSELIEKGKMQYVKYKENCETQLLQFSSFIKLENIDG